MTRIKYYEGQWFGIPLIDQGYATGIIVRGNYRARGGLGYFFGPKYSTIPSGDITYSKNKDNAILICIFGDLGIISGEWPLIFNGKPFIKEEWQVPLFHRVLPFPKDMAAIIDYGQDYPGFGNPITETVTKITDTVINLPKDGTFGSKAVEILLSKLLR